MHHHYLSGRCYPYNLLNTTAFPYSRQQPLPFHNTNVLSFKACTWPFFYYIFPVTLFWPAKTFLILKPFSSRGADHYYTYRNLYCLPATICAYKSNMWFSSSRRLQAGSCQVIRSYWFELSKQNLSLPLRRTPHCVITHRPFRPMKRGLSQNSAMTAPWQCPNYIMINRCAH
jgi:hypothetical protein